jgi:hypothetical protein
MAMSPQQGNARAPWKWPQPIRSVDDLIAAMRDGCTLKQLPDSIHFGLFRAGVRTYGILDEAFVIGAIRARRIARVVKTDDGATLFEVTHQLSQI